MSELKSFDRVAHVYDETRGLPPEIEQTIAKAILAELHVDGDTPRLLEVGVGTGRMAVPLAAAGVRVMGIDVSTKMIALLRAKRTDIDVALAEASQPPLREHVFDGALFVHILHLVPDAVATVGATLPLVRPGGVILQGQDARGNAGRGKADGLIEAAITDITGLSTDIEDRRVNGRTLCDRAVRAAGGTVDVRVIANWTSRTTARRMLDRLARKDFSSSWRIPDAKLPAVLERVTPQMEELFGGLDREMEFERSFSLFSGRLPG